MSIRIRINVCCNKFDENECVEEKKRKKSILCVNSSRFRLVSDVLHHVLSTQLEQNDYWNAAIHLSVDGYTLASSESVEVFRDDDVLVADISIPVQTHSKDEKLTHHTLRIGQSVAVLKCKERKNISEVESSSSSNSKKRRRLDRGDSVVRSAQRKQRSEALATASSGIAERHKDDNNESSVRKRSKCIASDDNGSTSTAVSSSPQIVDAADVRAVWRAMNVQQQQQQSQQPQLQSSVPTAVRERKPSVHAAKVRHAPTASSVPTPTSSSSNLRPPPPPGKPPQPPTPVNNKSSNSMHSSSSDSSRSSNGTGSISGSVRSPAADCRSLESMKARLLGSIDAAPTAVVVPAVAAQEGNKSSKNTYINAKLGQKTTASNNSNSNQQRKADRTGAAKAKGPSYDSLPAVRSAGGLRAGDVAVFKHLRLCERTLSPVLSDYVKIAVTAVDTEGRPPAAAQLVATVLKAGRGDDSFAAGEEVRLPWADMQAVRLLERTESSSACGDYSPSMLESSSVTIGPAAAAAAEASDATTPPGQGFVNTAVDTMPAQEGSEGEEYLGADGDEDLSLFDMFAQIIEEKKLSLAAS